MSVPLLDAIAELGAKRAAEGGLTADAVLEKIDPFFTSLLDLLPNTDSPAVIPIDNRKPCTHARLRQFIVDIGPSFWKCNVGRNDRVALLLPNGPELAVAFVAVLTYCCCAPLNPANTAGEIQGELLNVSARAMIIMSGEDNEGVLKVSETLDLLVLEATPLADEAGLFTLVDALGGLRDTTIQALPEDRRKPQQRLDTAMVLHTSGSTGNKKVVPHLVEDLLAGAICIAAACQLKPSDVCCNQMPLFHVGGIARNVLSPIISGGSVVAMPYFEPALFWSVCAQHQATWCADPHSSPCVVACASPRMPAVHWVPPSPGTTRGPRCTC